VVRGTAGFVETQIGGDPTLSSRARGIEELEQLSKLLGTRDPFGLAEFAASFGGENLGAARRLAQPRETPFQKIPELFFPPTAQQKELRQKFGKFIEETGGRGPSFQDWVEELKKLNANVESTIKGNEAKISPEGE